MAKKRIVELTFADGTKKYRVERPAIHIFGLPLLWTIEAVRDPLYDRPTGAVFDTLRDATRFCGMGEMEIVGKKVIMKS